MSKKRGRQTAADFMAELERDPNFLRLRAEKDEKLRLLNERLDVIKTPMLQALEEVGFTADSIEGVLKYAPLPPLAVDILLQCLNQCQDEQVQESLVRALGAANSSFDGQSLVALFEATSNEGLRFAILNTVALVKPTGIGEWLAKALQDDYLRHKLSDLGYDLRTR